MNVTDLIGNHVATAQVAAIGAGTATRKDTIFKAPFKCVVTGIKVVPVNAGVTGDNTNSKNLNVLNAGAAGAGVVEVANLDLITGVDLTAHDAKEIPLNTTYEDGVEMAADDVLVLQTELVGGGVAMDELLVEVKYRGNGV